MMNRHSIHKSTFLIILAGVLFLASCGGSEGTTKLISSSLPGENPSSYNPSGTAPTPSTAPAAEDCTNTETVTYSPKSIDFGLNQISTAEFSTRECQTVSVNPCFQIEANIDASSSTDLNPADATSITPVQEFEQSSKPGQIEVCYNRIAEGKHTGKLSVRLNGAYTFIVPLAGQTLPKVFALTKPATDPFLVSGTPKVATPEQNVPYYEYFEVPVEGNVDVTKYAALLKDKKKDVTISVTNGGITSKLPYDEKGHFSGIIQIPNVGRTYPVTFTIETIKGKLTTTRQFITASAPSATLEVRDGEGALVNVVPGDDTKNHNDTNSTQLVAGLKIGNLDVSAPNKDHPLGATFKLKIFNPKDDNKPKTLVYRENQAKPEDSWVPETSNTAEEITFSADYLKVYEQEVTASNEANKKEASTDYLFVQCKKIEDFKTNTLCVPLPPTGLLGKGVNQIEATICNDITGTTDEGCKHQKVTVIVNNDLPRIIIQAPLANAVYNTVDNPDKTNTHIKTKDDVILKGVVENYKPETKDKEGKLTDCGVYFWFNQSDNKDNRLTNGSATDKKLICLSAKSIDGSAIENSYQTGNQGNIKSGTFSINLSKEFPELLTRYTNLVQIRAENTQGHVAYKTVSFQVGLKSKGEITTTAHSKNIMSGEMGSVINNQNHTHRAPLMINVSNGTLQDQNLRMVIEKVLNDNLKLKDLIQGYSEVDEDAVKNTTSCTNKVGEIPCDLEANSHDNGVARVMQWVKNNRQNFNPINTNNACGFNTKGTCAAILFVKNLNDPKLFGDNLKNEAFWSPVVFGKRNSNGELLDANNTVIPTGENGWPVNKSDVNNIAPDYDFDDVTQGPVTVDKLELGNDGEISANVTIKDFKGHAFAFSMCELGSLSFPPIIPITFNISELHLRIKLAVKKIQLDNKGKEIVLDAKDAYGYPIPENRNCVGGQCTNKIIIYPMNISLGGPELEQGVYMSPSESCNDSHVGAIWSKDRNFEPFGCNLHDDFIANGYDRYYWVNLETRNKLDYLAINPGPGLIVQLQEVLRHQFGDMISCDIPKTMVNPLINESVFPYPDWVSDNKKGFGDKPFEINDDTKLYLTSKNGLVGFELKKKENSIFTGNLNLKDSDILVNDDSLKLKLPMSIGANNVKANMPDFWGHMYREPSASLDANYPLSEVKDKPYLGISIGIEELLHSATSVIFKKGIQPLLDLFDTEKFDFPKGYSHTDWQLGLDSVILGNLEICNDLADKLLKTSLPASMTFSNFQNLFTNNAAHWDITLDPNSPPTLNLIDIPVVNTEDSEAATAKPVTEKPTSSARLELGLTNIVISVSDFIKTAEDKEIYKIGEEFFKIRLDAIIKLNLDYYKDQRKIVIKIDPYNSIPAYVTVIDKGAAYDDAKVLVDLKDLLLKKAFNSLADGTMEITFPANLSGFNTIGFGREGSDKVEEAQKAGGVVILDKTKLGENGSCDDITTPEYDESSTRFTINHDILINGYNQKPIAMQNIKDLLIPKNILSDIPRSLLQNNVNSANSTNTDTPVDMSDPCDVDPTLSEIDGNDIKDSLCDAGIKEISLGEGDPNIIFDTENGYIHLSTKIMIEVYDWLSKQNNGEDI